MNIPYCLCDWCPCLCQLFCHSNGLPPRPARKWSGRTPPALPCCRVTACTDRCATHLLSSALTFRTAARTAIRLPWAVTADLAPRSKRLQAPRRTAAVMCCLPCCRAELSPVRPCGRRWACAAPASRSGMRAVRSVLPQKATAMAWGSASGVPRHWLSRGRTLPTSWPITTPELPCPDKKEPISRRRLAL